MKNLEDLIREKKCRVGRPYGIDLDGEFWIVTKDPITIRSFGGDGVGNSTPSRYVYLELRHYRDDRVRAYAVDHSWHQNDGDFDCLYLIDELLEACTQNDLHFLLLLVGDKRQFIFFEGNCEYINKLLVEAMTYLGLPVMVIAPDELIV